MSQENNPFAICSAKIDREAEPEKWERCVKELKEKLGMPESTETALSEVPGGGYLSEFNEESECWAIRDLPFFSELPAGTRSNEKAISREWMEAVVRRHRTLEEEQKHLPPVHANHHDAGRENFRIGFLRPTRVGRLILDGKPRWTLFGDIVRIEDRHYAEIKDLGYPYRSAEIGIGWKPEISSLALLADEAPHFKLPMLTIGEERRHFDRGFLPEQAPALAFSEIGESAYVCFSFRGATMPKKKDEIVKLQDDPEKKDDKGNTDEVTSGIVKVVEKFLPDMVKRLFEEMVVRTQEGEQTVEPEMLKEEEKAELAKKAKAEAGDERIVNMMSKIALLEERDRQRDLAEKTEKVVQEKAAALRSDGWHVSEESESAMLLIAKESTAALDTHVENFRKTMPKDPPRTLEEGTEVFAADSPILQKYTTQSPEVLEAARTFARQYDELKDGGAKLETSQEEFIDINLESVTA